VTEVRAAIYCRLSKAKDGDTTKVEEQERLCRALAAQRGLTVIDPPFTDNDVTAAKGNARSRPRPGYNALLAAITDGKVDAVVAWHTDRLHRNLSELEEYIAVCGQGRHGVPTYTVKGGNLDLSTASGRMVAGILGSVAKNEVEHMSERMRAGHDRRRLQGIVRAGGPGGRAFAFESDGVTQVPAECELVREAAARVLAGDGVSAICRDLTARGVVTTTGRPFGHGTLRKLLARPRYAGLMPDGASPAAWPAVLERDTWELVRSVLDSRAAGYGHATNARRYLLSGIALCGACGKPLRFKASKGRGNGSYQTGYACAEPGCRKVWRDQAMLDAYVTTRAVSRLAHPASPEPQVPAAPVLAAEFAALSAQLAETDAALADHTRGAVGALLARRDGIERRLADLRELAAGDAAARLRGSHAGITLAEFKGLPLGQQRALIAATFRITVLPASKRGPGFRTEDVQMSPL
jgi:DNA invertase Pin-like site-specific DNA recombinase